ncbi:hypothetical protein OROMI_034478 [Orobanche minor]
MSSTCISPPFTSLFESLLNKEDLSEDEAEGSLDFLLSDCTEALISAFLVLLRPKGETYEEQGNRSSSSACGSADVLEVLGVPIDVEPQRKGWVVHKAKQLAVVEIELGENPQLATKTEDIAKGKSMKRDKKSLGVKTCVEQVGIGFMMSLNYHPAMKTFAPVRKKLGIKTVFNFLGPMLNPACVPFSVVGVYKEDMSTIFEHMTTTTSNSKFRITSVQCLGIQSICKR